MSQLFDEAVQFTDEVTGELLVGGLLYIGSNGLDAKLNPISIFSNRELTGTPLANPQTIGSDGRAENKIWLSGKYSFKVEDSANTQKYNELENGFDEQVGNTLLINALGVNDVVVNGSPTVTTLVDSQTYIFTAPADNTGAMTLKIDNTPVMPLKVHHDQALALGDIKQDQKVVIVANLTDSVYEVQTDLSGVTLNGVETLTNKTLTAPVITDPVITNPIINGNPIDGSIVSLFYDSGVILTAITTLDITGLDLGSTETYKITFAAQTALTNVSFSLTANGLNTLTDYYSQFLIINNAAITASRINSPLFSRVSGGFSSTEGFISLGQNNDFIARSFYSESNGAGIIMRESLVSKTVALSGNLTSLRITADTANGIGIGSRVRIYKTI